jgi:hypothetical protein
MQGCNSPRIKPPKVPSCIVLEGSLCSCYDGEFEIITDCFGYIATSPENYEKLRAHFDSVTERLEICLANPKKCK